MPKSTRTEQKNVRFTPQEVERIEAAADLERDSMAAFLRKAALDRADVILANIKPSK